MSKSAVLVVDSGAFIANANVGDFGDEVYTVDAVLREIRDRETRRRLETVPYTIRTKEPTVESLAAVTEAAKQSGDFRSLSATDIKVIALTYELDKELKSRQPADQERTAGEEEEEEEGADAQLDEEEEEEEDEEAGDGDEKEKEEAEGDTEMKETEGAEGGGEEEMEEAAGDNEKEVEEATGDREKGMEDEDVGDWVTPENFSTFDFDSCFGFRGHGVEEPDALPPAVTCLTADFAMQNVLLRLGLGIRGVNGRVIRNPKSFVLWCYACFSHTLNQTKRFCPRCGNQSLRKVTASLEGGEVRLHFSSKYQLSNKGKNRQTAPAFRGGKHSRNPLLTEDQPRPQQRPSKKALRGAAGAESAEAPFAMRDVHSRAARRGHNRRRR